MEIHSDGLENRLSTESMPHTSTINEAISPLFSARLRVLKTQKCN